MTVTNVTVDGNSAVGSGADQGGAGVFNAGGTIEIMSSTISNNMVTGMGNGGGIHNDAGGMLMLTASTVSGNSSANSGGGITNGGAMMVSTSTVANNMAMMMGGGVMQMDGDNMITLRSSIIATNTADGMGQDVAGGGTMLSAGYNLIGQDDTDAFPADMTDVEGTADMPVDPNLSPLANNGGMTQTHALNCPSPAINAGDPEDNTPDQRGEMVFGVQRDMGAFEFQEPCVPDATTGVVGDLSGSTLFPNPAKAGLVQLEIPESFGNNVTIRISEMATGKHLQQLQTSYGTADLDVSTYPAGTYTVQVYAKEGVESHRLIIVQ